MGKINIFGIETEKSVYDWTEKFKEVSWTDEETLYESNELFHHNEDDGLDFDYKYYVRFIELDNLINYELLMVIMPNSMDKGVLKKMRNFYGGDNLHPIDIIDYGCSITFGSGNIVDWDEEYEILIKIANVFECMDNLRGFYLDKTWNLIGSNGWDTIRHTLYGDDLFKPAMDRMNERNKIKATV